MSLEEEIEQLKKLAGIYQPYNTKDNIQPGTPEWFKLWFSLPKMTGEQPYKKE